jgi:hypothetical protein
MMTISNHFPEVIVPIPHTFGGYAPIVSTNNFRLGNSVASGSAVRCPKKWCLVE